MSFSRLNRSVEVLVLEGISCTIFRPKVCDFRITEFRK